MSSKELGTVLYPPQGLDADKHYTEPDLSYLHQEMQKKGVTLTLLWEEYKQEHPDGLMFTQFCSRYREFRKRNNVYMRRIYKAGERAMVDWAGQTMSYTDETGKQQTVYLFVAVLPASSYMYAEPYRNMSLSSWISGHVNAYGYFGGVPRLTIPDNAKTAVVKADYYDPKLNRTYREMARHYGTAILPARPLKPRDKAPVETGVQIVERRIIAKLRKEHFLSFEDLRDAVDVALDELNNRPFQKLPSNRRETFLKQEKTALYPLPARRFEYAEWKSCKVAFDYHIPYDEHFYSVPFEFAGKQVEIRATVNTLEIFYEHERIASHVRQYLQKKRYNTLSDHMPSQHKAIVDWSSERFLSWASKVGPETVKYIRYILSSREHPEQAYKTCAGILRHIDKLTSEQMEQACHTAFERNVYTYKYFGFCVKSILSCDSKPTSIIRHDNVRGVSYYGGGKNAR
jgi:transposase